MGGGESHRVFLVVYWVHRPRVLFKKFRGLPRKVGSCSCSLCFFLKEAARLVLEDADGDHQELVLLKLLVFR